MSHGRHSVFDRLAVRGAPAVAAREGDPRVGRVERLEQPDDRQRLVEPRLGLDRDAVRLGGQQQAQATLVEPAGTSYRPVYSSPPASDAP